MRLKRTEKFELGISSFVCLPLEFVLALYRAIYQAFTFYFLFLGIKSAFPSLSLHDKSRWKFSCASNLQQQKDLDLLFEQAGQISAHFHDCVQSWCPPEAKFITGQY
jgi:hypothetical protein